MHAIAGLRRLKANSEVEKRHANLLLARASQENCLEPNLLSDDSDDSDNQDDFAQIDIRRTRQQTFAILGFDLIGRRPKRSDLTKSERVWLWSNDPLSSIGAWLWAALILILIILSSTTFVLESLPKLCCGRYDWLWKPIEIVCIAAFTLEYTARFASCPWYFPLDAPSKIDPVDQENDAKLPAHLRRKVPVESIRTHVVARLRFGTNVLNMIDLLAISPFYVELFVNLGSPNSNVPNWLRIFRLVRVVRLLKLSKYSEGLQLMGKTLYQSSSALGMLLFAEGVCVILLSTAVYFAERGVLCDKKNNFCGGTAEPMLGLAGQEPEGGWYASRGAFEGATYWNCPEAPFCRRKSSIISIPAAAYWCVQTITTTGYGDVNTETIIGKCVAVATMLMGLVMLALPITIISENFALEYQRKELLRLEEEERQTRAIIFEHKRRTRSENPKKTGDTPAATRKRFNQIVPKPQPCNNADHPASDKEEADAGAVARRRMSFQDSSTASDAINTAPRLALGIASQPIMPSLVDSDLGGDQQEQEGAKASKETLIILPGQTATSEGTGGRSMDCHGVEEVTRAAVAANVRSFNQEDTSQSSSKSLDEIMSSQELHDMQMLDQLQSSEVDAIYFKKCVRLLIRQHRAILFRALREMLENQTERIVEKVMKNMRDSTMMEHMMVQHLHSIESVNSGFSQSTHDMHVNHAYATNTGGESVVGASGKELQESHSTQKERDDGHDRDLVLDSAEPVVWKRRRESLSAPELESDHHRSSPSQPARSAAQDADLDSEAACVLAPAFRAPMNVQEVPRRKSGRLETLKPLPPMQARVDASTGNANSGARAGGGSSRDGGIEGADSTQSPSHRGLHAGDFNERGFKAVPVSGMGGDRGRGRDRARERERGAGDVVSARADIGAQEDS